LIFSRNSKHLVMFMAFRLLDLKNLLHSQLSSLSKN